MPHLVTGIVHLITDREDKSGEPGNGLSVLMQGFIRNLQADVRTRKPAKPHKQGVCGLRMGFLQSFATVTAVMKGDRIFFY